MYIGLDDVIQHSYSIRKSVKSVYALLKLTKKQDAFYMCGADWGNIRKLYVLGSSDSREIDGMRNSILEPGYYLDKRTESEMLIIGASVQRIQEHLSQCGNNLENLSIHFTTLEKLDLDYVTGVTVLDLSNNENLRQITGMDKLVKLKRLYLDRTRFGPVLDLNPFSDLTWIEIGGTPIQKIRLEKQLKSVFLFDAKHTALCDVQFLPLFPRLINLNLEKSDVTQLPPLERLTNLKYLRIANTPIESLDQFQFPENIEEISLGGTSIRQLPPGLQELKKLRTLRLENLQLDDLPDWFPDLLQQDTYLYLRGTTVQGMEVDFLQQPREVILQWFEERKKANAGAPLNEVKVVFLGDGEAGKSHTIARLLNDGGAPVDFTGDSTPGIVITDKSYDIGDRNVQVHFWDFGGQEILHSMHRMFLTERTLYVILINARDDTQDDRARYWLHNVRSFANGAPVLLVLNKMDQNPNASVNESDLRALYPGLTEVVKLSALNDDPEKFNANFTEAMKRQIGSMENLSFFFPAAWTKAKQRLLGMTENYIRGSDYAVICDDCGVSDEGNLRKGLLNWFNDLGVSICYSGSRRLQDYVILRPNWITNAIYAVLFNKHPETRNGIISHDAIFEMIQPPKEGDDPYRRTNSTESYTDVEIAYILNVTRKFRLSFRVDDDHEFIPMLCDRESKPIAAEYATDPDALEFHMSFDYLPGNVLHRLMVELRQDLDTTRVWRTGAHFEQKSSGLSAVVKSEDKVLKIFVRGSGKSHKSNTYLCILKDTLDRIVKDMNLEAPVNEVVYKLEGKRQAFDYDELVESQEHGETTRYSRVHKRRLLIDDILNQTCRGVELERERLLRDVLTTCGQMQANKQNWKSGDDKVREDDRNTYIRDLLRAKGYHVSDQTFSGSSATGKQAGEVDLMILRESDSPWTLIEALNISGKQFQNWEKHLTKLLDHYNANGLQFLFLMSYVDVSRDAYGGVVSAYSEHLRFYSPDQYVLQSEEPVNVGIDPGHYIQTAKCVYDRGGFPTTVYHIFVRMGA